jgi:hypothetical protein
VRLDNDRPVEQQTPAPDFFSVLSFGVLCGLGIMSFLFSPLAMLWAHTRLIEPWPKLAAVIGAVVAIAVFNQSPAVVVLSFVYGLVCADTITRGIARPIGFLRVIAVGMTITTLVIVFLARMENLDPWAFWVRQVSDTVDALAIQWQASSQNPWIGMHGSRFSFTRDRFNTLPCSFSPSGLQLVPAPILVGPKSQPLER